MIRFRNEQPVSCWRYDGRRGNARGRPPGRHPGPWGAGHVQPTPQPPQHLLILTTGHSGHAHAVVSLVRAESSLIFLSCPKLNTCACFLAVPCFGSFSLQSRRGSRGLLSGHTLKQARLTHQQGEASPPGSQVGTFLVCTGANSNQPVSFSRFDFNPMTIKPSRKLQTS